MSSATLGCIGGESLHPCCYQAFKFSFGLRLWFEAVNHEVSDPQTARTGDSNEENLTFDRRVRDIGGLTSHHPVGREQSQSGKHANVMPAKRCLPDVKTP